MKKIGLIIFCLLVSGAIQRAYAQEGQFSVGILPPILEINADPPAKIESIISVHNLNDNSRDLNIVFRSFRPSDQKNGQIEYLAENKIEGPDPLILQKIGIYEGERQVSKISLGPFETKELKMKISIEPGAPIGDFYFSSGKFGIFFSKHPSRRHRNKCNSVGRQKGRNTRRNC